MKVPHKFSLMQTTSSAALVVAISLSALTGCKESDSNSVALGEESTGLKVLHPHWMMDM